MMVSDEIILKAILKEMPNLSPWCDDEWGDMDINWVTKAVERTYFDPNAMRRSLIDFAKLMLPSEGSRPYPGIHALKEQNHRDVVNFANIVMKRIKSYSMVDNDLHGILDV